MIIHHVFRQSILLLLLSAFVFNITGAVASFFLWKWQVMEQLEEFAATLDNNRLIAIPLHSAEGADEFSIDGKMYDVIRTGMVAGTTYAFCIRDIGEEKILDNMENDEFSKARRELDHHARTLFKKLQDHFREDHLAFMLQPGLLVSTSCSLTRSTQSALVLKDTPPPRICC